MIAYYLDSSAWLKHYRVERGSEFVNTLFDNANLLGSAELGPIELISAFARRRISGEIDTDAFAKFESQMKEDWEAFEKTSLIESVTSLAGKLAAAYGLRGADSIHLAAASRMAFALMDRNIRTIFVSSDRDLNDAAKLVGFEVLDPQESKL